MMPGWLPEPGEEREIRPDMTIRTADHEFMRSLNRAAILNHIRIHGETKRTDIAAATGLSVTTISEIVSGLIGEGLLTASARRAQGAGRGRPAAKLRLNASAAHVLGVKISPYQIGVALTDFAGNIVATSIVPIRAANHPPELVADLIADAIGHALLAAGYRIEEVEGVCVGVPGFVERRSGLVRWSPSLAGRDIAFGDMLGARLGCPAFVENDANLVTLAEQWFGAGRDEESFVVISVEHGVGMGLVIDGDLVRGAKGFAAEFGHMIIDPEGPLCRCGRKGCIEAFAADYALVRAAGRIDPAAATAQEPLRTKMLIGEMIADPDEPRARAAFHEAGVAVGVGLAHVVNLLNPGKVVFTGDMMRAAEAFVPVAIETAEARMISELRGETEYAVQRQGDEAWARGAAAAVLQKLYREPSGRRLAARARDRSSQT